MFSATSAANWRTHFEARRFKFNWREERKGFALRRVSKESPGGNYHRSEIFGGNKREKQEKKFFSVVKHREKRVRQTGILLIIN